MGAWGHRSFENDAALDWLGSLATGGVLSIIAALAAAADLPDEQEIDVDDASAAIAAGELVAAARGRGDERLEPRAAAWLALHRPAVAVIDLELARRAVERVLERSELAELWDEGGGDSDWHVEVAELLHRLKLAR